MSRSAAWRAVCLDALPIAAVAWVVFYLLCIHVMDCYRVPTGSMEPTIHGHPDSGDQVLVDKTAFWFSRRPEPFDTVVMSGLNPGDNPLVKRCAVIGPARLRIEDGDLYREVVGIGFEHPIEKDPVTMADMRVPVFRYPDGPCAQTLEDFFHLPSDVARVGEDGAVYLGTACATLDRETVDKETVDKETVDKETVDKETAEKETAEKESGSKSGLLALLKPAARQPGSGEVAPPRIPGFLATQKGVDTSYMTPEGRRERQNMNYYADIGFELALVPDPGIDALAFVLQYSQRDYGLVWKRDGTLLLILAGKIAREVRADPWPDGGFGIAFGYLDGRLFLVQDGAHVQFLDRVPLDLSDAMSPARPNGLQLGCVGRSESDVVVRRIRVFHDVAVTRLGGAHEKGASTYDVPPDYMFLLGDNSSDSQDSRGSLGCVPLRRLAGRPFAILAPASRARFFVR